MLQPIYSHTRDRTGGLVKLTDSTSFLDLWLAAVCLELASSALTLSSPR